MRKKIAQTHPTHQGSLGYRQLSSLALTLFLHHMSPVNVSCLQHSLCLQRRPQLSQKHLESQGLWPIGAQFSMLMWAPQSLDLDIWFPYLSNL